MTNADPYLYPLVISMIIFIAVFIDSSDLDFEQVLARIMEELGRRGIAGAAKSLSAP